eukprot:CAMPEP_0195526506 /NCGR_PEP_ID=MMETSP0794_2-20130614/27611_1 /TAXON_ID=515487 /ORGANISM="Stephanopyxis turris, Strain CCMP 815" /LENGTH=287 /DNA_ID=CAMNT_0040657209 /DNA_START=16 /DNA_END=879 /DNA_ORIENTATION=-
MACSDAKREEAFITDHSKHTHLKVFTFPPTPHVYNVSPFTIKLESFLRLHEIPYDPIHGMKFGPKRMIPYIQLPSGEEIGDSNVIIRRLKKIYEVDKDVHLEPADKAVAHAFTRMLEEHTAQIGFHYRYGLNMNTFYDVLSIPHAFYNANNCEEGRSKAEFWLKIQPDVTMKKTKYRGLGVHSDEELWSFSNDDLKAISDYLSDKPWFFGSEPTTMDCVLFGHLVQFLYIPMDFPQKTFLHNNCANLVRFVERFKVDYWPDWEEKCKPLYHNEAGEEGLTVPSQEKV